MSESLERQPAAANGYLARLGMTQRLRDQMLLCDDLGMRMCCLFYSGQIPSLSLLERVPLLSRGRRILSGWICNRPAHDNHDTLSHDLATFLDTLHICVLHRIEMLRLLTFADTHSVTHGQNIASGLDFHNLVHNVLNDIKIASLDRLMSLYFYLA